MSDNNSGTSSNDNKPPAIGSGGRGQEGDGSAAQPAEAVAAAGGSSDNKKKRRKDGRLYIEKNSLDEPSLLAAREEARIKLEKINERGDATEHDINEDRRAANRLSAFQSRKRRKGNVKELQSKVADLSAQNNEQVQKIGDQQAELKAVLEENARLRRPIAFGSNARQEGIPTEIGGPGAAVAGGQSSSSDERKPPAAQQEAISVFQMIHKLKDLNEKQGDELRQQKMDQKASRQKLTVSHNKEQQSLIAAQGKAANEMAQSQLQERNELAAAQSSQLSETMTAFGFQADKTAEALQLFRELNDVQAATAQVTAAAEQVVAASRQIQQQEQEHQQPAEGNDADAAAEALNQLHHSLHQRGSPSNEEEEEEDDEEEGSASSS